jgi:hypothetical protein
MDQALHAQRMRFIHQGRHVELRQVRVMWQKPVVERVLIVLLMCLLLQEPLVELALEIVM